MKETLEQLGLSGFDAELYLALLARGLTPVGVLVDDLKSHRELVYGGLKRLEYQGLVQTIEKKKIKHYQALEPELLVRKIEKQAELAQKALPSLKKIYQQMPLSIRIFEGPEGFEEIQRDIQTLLKDKEDYFVIGGAGEAWYGVVKDFYKTYHKKLLKRGIKMLTVTYEKEAEGIIKYELSGFNPIRILPDKFSVPSSTMIYADKIIIQIFGEKPVAIMIHSKEVSKSYKNYFQSLWGIAKPYNS